MTGWFNRRLMAVAAIALVALLALTRVPERLRRKRHPLTLPPHTDDEHHDDEHHDDEHHDELAQGIDDALPHLVPLALAPGDTVQVVATSNIVADVVAQVGGDRIELTALMPPGADPHGYTPTPQDLRLLNDADVIFVNGLGLQEGLLSILTNLDRPVPLVSVNVGVETVEYGDDHHHHDHDDHDHDDHDHDDHDHDHAHHDDDHDHDDHDHDHHHHDDDHDHHSGEALRLLAIADYDGVVHIMSLDSFEIVETFTLAGAARLYPVFEDRFVFAVQTDADQVDVINSGVEEIPHDDHMHIMLGAPSLAPLSFSAATPIHFAAHGSQVAIFNDGDGTAVIVNRSDLAHADADLVYFDSGRAHHGSAVPMHDTVILSIPEMDSDAALPIGVRALTLEGEEVVRFEECPGLHGEASLGHRVVFGCSDGLLVLHEHDGEYEAAKIPNPTAEGRTGSFATHPDANRILGNYTRFGIVVIDPRGLTSELIQLPIEIRNFYFHPHHTDEAVVLTVDGVLHIIDLESGEIEASLDVVEDFAELYRDRDNRAPLPYLQVVEDFAFIADQAGDIIVVDLEEWATVATLSPGVSVLSMAGFGRAEAANALEHGHAHHDEDDHDDHDHDHAHHDDDDDHDHDHAHHDDDAHAHDDHGHHHHHDGDDPHTWQSVRNVMVWVSNIEAALDALDPDHASVYAANAEAYLAELAVLDAEIRAMVDQIPVENRKLVSDHDSFSYFALDYGFEVIGAIIPGFSTLAAASAQELAALQDQMVAENVQAIFVGTTVNPGLAQRMAEDLGIRVVPLYSDSLSDADGPASTYVAFMRYNAAAIVEALR